eukprot:gene26535-32570_t
MAQIARGKASDHSGEVVLLPNADFDISKSIFETLTSPLTRMLISDKVGVVLFWSDKAEQKIRNEFSVVPRAPRFDQPLVDFMNTECDFAVEHADGSFMDHLKFCYEYSFAHFPERSPRVLLLHSIMGVGSNFFPMHRSKVPALQALVTEYEFSQISIFPTLLRLLQGGILLDELATLSGARLQELETFSCHRVLDNEWVTVSSDVFWDQLNYQLIHLLDFLPAASWQRHMDDGFLATFTVLHSILEKT